jgi:hypothetical protein
VKSVSTANFGLAIAYVLPGAALLWGLRPFVPALDLLLGTPTGDAATLGGFLTATLAALGVGLTVSTVRWLVIDTLHHVTGLTPPAWDFAKLAARADAFDLIVEHTYRYYQFSANTVVSLLVVFVVRRWSLGLLSGWGWVDVGLLALVAVLLAGSRDSLRRYYARGGALLGAAPSAPARSAKGQSGRGRRRTTSASTSARSAAMVVPNASATFLATRIEGMRSPRSRRPT